MDLKRFFVRSKTGDGIYKNLVVFAIGKTEVVNYLKSGGKEVVNISMEDSTVLDFGGDKVFSITVNNTGQSVMAIATDIFKLFIEYPDAKEVAFEYSTNSDVAISIVNYPEVVILRG